MTDGYDDDPGDLTLERFKRMADCGLVLFKGHGNVGCNVPVLFTHTAQGKLAAETWCAGETGMVTRQVSLDYGTFFGVSCDNSWYAANWQSGLNDGNAIVFWESCYSGDGVSIEQSAGGRCRFAWNGEVSDEEAASEIRGTLEVMSKNPNARSAALALEAGSGYMYGTCKVKGNLWTTLCPGPIPDAGCFPKDVVKKNTPALGCMILDTFIDSIWEPDELIEANGGEADDGDVSPDWLRQEGCNLPFGVRFRIFKASDQAVDVTASYRRIRNKGEAFQGLPSFTKSGIEEVDDAIWDSSAAGRSLDADGMAPNNTDLKWRY